MDNGYMQQFTDKERLARIETLLYTMSESSNRFETSLLDMVGKIEAKQNQLEATLSSHVGEDGKTYKSLKYKVLEYLVIFILGAVLMYLVEIGTGG